MFAAGIVAEYNPFHNGHKYHIEQTKKQGADHIVVILSGDAVQRGDVAVCSKYDRAQMAIDQGADLVIELPAPYSCAPAQVFALNAVRLLGGFGENVIRSMSFGCECADTDKLESAADLISELEHSERFKELIADGLTYPQAVSMAAQELSEDIKDILSDANNVLGIEYIRAARAVAPWLRTICIKRKGAGHGDDKVYNEFANATFLRERVRSGEDISSFVPTVPQGPAAFISRSDRTILYKIMSADEKSVQSCPFVTQSLINRLNKAIARCPGSMDELAELIKSKDVTMSRVRRFLMHIALGITQKDMLTPVPYGRILALNRKGAQVLVSAKNRTLEYDTSLARLEKNDCSKRTAFLECNAVRLREVCAGVSFSNEYKRKIVITK